MSTQTGNIEKLVVISSMLEFFFDKVRRIGKFNRLIRQTFNRIMIKVTIIFSIHIIHRRISSNIYENIVMSLRKIFFLNNILIVYTPYG